MGHVANGRKARAGLGLLLTVLLFLAVVAPAQAVPFHPRKEALDVTGLNHACGAAVDSKGDFYASSAGAAKVNIYDASHKLLTEIPDSNVPCGLAITTEGALYVSEKATGEVVRFKPNAYPFAGTPTYGSREVIDASGKAKGIAVDPKDNRLYVAEGDHVAVYSSTGVFEANVGEGKLTEATGVAPFTFTAGITTDRYLWVADARGLEDDRLYLFTALGTEVKSLAAHGELSGTPSGKFGFGTAGAYLAADPGNRSGEKCIAVSAQACGAGHVFLYDAAHKALDEFDASGEYFGRTMNASFADAEPTAIAVDRSGGSNDGTLYVTTGAGAGAKALAFGPLEQPKRETLGEPLSHILAGSKAVATDSHGDVYALAGSFIHIYGPDGKAIAECEDSFKPRDIAVDSTGKIYVMDAEAELNEKEQAVTGVTYYTPSSFPPKAGMECLRQESTIVTSEQFPTGGKVMRAIAVNPGPGKGKDQLFVLANSTTRRYDSAANLSKELDKEFGKCVPSNNHVSVSVNGANGNVYVGANPNLIYAVNEAGTECFPVFDDKGSSSGKGAPIAFSAVDQSNGHVIAYDGTTGTVHEYDAAGSFVAEFGNFTEGLAIPYRVAVDNACALQQLVGKACEEYDSANGNVYVAFDDPNEKLHPPYDVTAFGPLKYPAPPKHKLTVKKTGVGSGTVTSEPAGINCGGTCSAEFDETEVVTLTAVADPKSKFVAWTGCEAEPSPTKCEVTVSKEKEVTAEFTAKLKFKLTVTKAGTGSGKVTSSPASISCGATCSAEFEEGTEVTLSASPEAGSTFSGWSGSGCTGTGTCKVTMNEAKSVTATFDLKATPKFKLTVTKAGTGSGKVTSEPPGISCGATCSAEFEEGTTVNLSAFAAEGSEFREWGGACSGVGICEVTITEAKEVTAFFAHAKQVLTVIQKGSGAGTTTSKPKGVKCATTCSLAEAKLYKGTPVLLKVKAASGSNVAGFTGCDKSSKLNETEATCEVTMAEAKTVEVEYGGTAKAILNPKFLTFEKAIGTGQGTVKAMGLTCEAACTLTKAAYTSGDGGKKLPAVMTLKATAAFGSELSGWTGCASNPTPGECVVTMSTDRTVSAQFTAKATTTLSLSRSGGGTVSSKPKGIKCASTCDTAVASLPQDTVVVLKAVAAAGSEFSSWEGCAVLTQTTLESTCEVTLSAAKAVKATFTASVKPLTSPKPLTVTKAGTGYGTVKATGLTCEAACISTEVEYFGGVAVPKPKAAATVTLKATPQAGSDPVSWTGCESNPTPSECVVSMSSAKKVIARFEE
jgi:sugar lactone lactonase YvrE